MDLSPDLVIPRLRCATFHGSQAADPIGSVGVYDAFLFVDIPLPWERDISTHEPFASIGTPGNGGPDATLRWRPMGTVPDGPPGLTRVVAHRRPLDVDGVAPYRRREWSVAADQVEPLCRAVMSGDADGLGAFEVHRCESHPVSAALTVTDLHVCTHGRRDSCCGSLGAAMFQGLVGPPAPRPDRLPRVARCSHTGGHRFAPTALTFPDGYGWAHLTADLADRLVSRDGPPSVFAAHCRGSSLFDGAPAQAADRAALVEVGWVWADSVRRARVMRFERDTLATTVRIGGELPDGDRPVFDVRVELDRHIPAPTCGMVDGPEYRVEPVWRIAGVDRLRASGSAVQ